MNNNLHIFIKLLFTLVLVLIFFFLAADIAFAAEITEDKFPIKCKGELILPYKSYIATITETIGYYALAYKYYILLGILVGVIITVQIISSTHVDMPMAEIFTPEEITRLIYSKGLPNVSSQLLVDAQLVNPNIISDAAFHAKMPSIILVNPADLFLVPIPNIADQSKDLAFAVSLNHDIYGIYYIIGGEIDVNFYASIAWQCLEPGNHVPDELVFNVYQVAVADPANCLFTTYYKVDIVREDILLNLQTVFIKAPV